MNRPLDGSMVSTSSMVELLGPGNVEATVISPVEVVVIGEYFPETENTLEFFAGSYVLKLAGALVQHTVCALYAVGEAEPFG